MLIQKVTFMVVDKSNFFCILGKNTEQFDEIDHFGLQNSKFAVSKPVFCCRCNKKLKNGVCFSYFIALQRLTKAAHPIGLEFRNVSTIDNKL